MKLLTAVLGGMLAGCQAGDVGLGERAQPVVGADVDTGDPAVVALMNGNFVFCTGTLVSPRVIVTAAHCIDEGGAVPSAFFASDATGAGVRVGAERTSVHPEWTGELSGGHDVGLILLSGRGPVPPVPINTAAVAGMIGAPYRVVGFGIHDRDTRELDGKKRTAVMKISGVTGTYVEVGDADPTMAPDTAICQGDSGGPGFISVDDGAGPVEKLAGVHSYSIEGCFNPSGDTRLDLVGDFVQPWIDANDPSCGNDATCAPIGCAHDPDCEPCGADGTCTTGCALPDPDCPTQALGETCRADSQCLTGLCLYWPTDPRVKFCSQPCGEGCPEPMACETIQPFGPVCSYGDTPPPGALSEGCTDDGECAGLICEDHACTYTCDLSIGEVCPAGFTCADHGLGFHCFGDYGLDGGDGGGCAVGGGAGTLALSLGLPGLLVRRRRRRAWPRHCDSPRVTSAWTK